MAKKLARVDDAFAVTRHITEMSTTAFYEDVRAELRENMPTPPTPATRPTSTAPSTKPTTACRSSRSRTEELLQKAVNTPIDENDTDLQATESLASVHPPGLTTYDRIEHVNEGPPLAPTFARPGADARAQGALPVAAKAPPAVPAAIGVRGAAAPGQGACATPCHNTGPVSLPRESDASDSDDENDDDQTCSSMPVPNGSMDRDIEVICYATHVLMATTLPHEDMDVVRQCLNRLRRVDAVTNNTGPFSLVTCNGYKQVRFAELINVTASNLLDAQGIDSQEHDEDDTRKTDHCWTAYDAFQLWIRCATGQG